MLSEKDFHFLQIASNFPQNKKDKYYNNEFNYHVLKNKGDCAQGCNPIWFVT